MTPFGQKGSIYPCWLLIFILTLFLPGQVLGAGAVVSQSLSFGTIDLHPAGDTITIAAGAGAAVSVSTTGKSIVTSGYSGLITVTSLAIEHVDIIYPASVIMASGPHTIEIVSIGVNSQYNIGGTDTLGSNIPLTISVGGSINIPGGQVNGSYTALMTILLNYS